PVMQAYQQDRGAYFATPPVNLIYALDVSLGHILDEGMEARFARHQLMGHSFRDAMQALGLEIIARPGLEAPTVTATYYPAGVDGALLPKVAEQGVTIAGGVLPSLAGKYFRVGHMGTCTPGDLIATIGAIERGLTAMGARVSPGAGVAAAEKALSRPA
ncbi:MAG: alanine--glyoxylate aminotransferase family protein, partial [Chloroflexota bacterium]|nr:alanine--glyoxylate aminotransferase family protein [Chloroflexota bacterium]